MELILPCLYSELEGKALPKIVNEIKKTKYLNHVIVGLDRATENEARNAWKFFQSGYPFYFAMERWSRSSKFRQRT